MGKDDDFGGMKLEREVNRRKLYWGEVVEQGKNKDGVLLFLRVEWVVGRWRRGIETRKAVLAYLLMKTPKRSGWV